MYHTEEKDTIEHEDENLLISSKEEEPEVEPEVEP